MQTVEAANGTPAAAAALAISRSPFRQESPLSTEEKMAVEAQRLIDSSRQYGGEVIFVSNEVGMGIVPANAMARNYADLAGRCNQVIAKHADKVVFVSCGIGITLKHEEE